MRILTLHHQIKICMCCCASIIQIFNAYHPLFKRHSLADQFVEVTISGQKFTFDRLEAPFDTSTQGITCNFQIDDTASNSYIARETLSFLKWINGIQEYRGQPFPARSVVYLHLQTHINHVTGTAACFVLLMKLKTFAQLCSSSLNYC